jgi:hypothetical protein
MTRALYAFLLRLHPRAFRRQFAAEMLWIFDEVCAKEGPLILLLDRQVSFARQWFVRSGLWKVMLALAGATLQVIAFGAGWMASTSHTISRGIGAEHRGTQMTPLMSDLMLLTLWSVAIVFVGVFASASWVTRFNRRRLAPRRRYQIRCSNCATSPNFTPASRL